MNTRTAGNVIDLVQARKAATAFRQLDSLNRGKALSAASQLFSLRESEGPFMAIYGHLDAADRDTINGIIASLLHEQTTQKGR